MLIETLIIVFMVMCFLNYKNKFPMYVIGCFIILFMAFTTENPDYDAYIASYGNIAAQRSISELNWFEQDTGARLLMFICSRLEFSYEEFLLALSLITVFVIFYCLDKYCLAPSIALVVYFVVFYYHHMIQIRAFLGEWIVVYALLYLLYEKDRFSILKYIFLICIASTIKWSLVAFVICPIFIKFKCENIIIFDFIFFIMKDFIEYILINFMPMWVSQKSLHYFAAYDFFTVPHIHISSIVFTLGFTAIVWYVFKVKKTRFEFKKHDIVFKELLNINLLMMIPVGLILLVNNNFFRYNRVVIIVDIVILLNYWIKTRSYQRYYKKLVFAGTVLFFVGAELLTGHWYKQIVTNSVLKWLS